MLERSAVSIEAGSAADTVGCAEWLRLLRSARENVKPLAAEYARFSSAKPTGQRASLIHACIGPVAAMYHAGKRFLEGGYPESARNTYTRARTLIEKAAFMQGVRESLVDRDAILSPSASARLNDLSIGKPEEQRLLAEIAAQGGASGPMADVLIPALQAIVECGAFPVRRFALEGLSVLVRDWPERVRLIQSDLGANSSGDISNAVLRSFAAKRSRARLTVQAIAGDPTSRAEFLRRIGDGNEGEAPRAALVVSLGSLWRRASVDHREDLRPAISSLLIRVSNDVAACRTAGGSLLRRSLATVCAELGGDFPEVTRKALRTCLEAEGRGLGLSVSQAASEAKANDAVARAASMLLDDDRTRRASLARALHDPEGSYKLTHWGEALAAIPVELGCARDEDFSTRLIDRLCDVIECPPSDDAYSATLFLSAWKALRELLERIESDLLNRLPEYRLECAAEGREFALTPMAIEARLACTFVSVSRHELRQLCQPVDQALEYMTLEIPAGEIPVKFLRAVEWESAFLSGLPGRLGRWHDAPLRERIWLTATISLLCSGPRFEVPSCNRKLLPPLLAQLSDSPFSSKRTEYMRTLLCKLPEESGDALEEAIEEYVESAFQEESVAEKGLLNPSLLALVGKQNSFHVRVEVSRRAVLFIKRQLAQNVDFDVAKPLLQLALRGPDPELFDHIEVRIDSPEVRRICNFLKRHLTWVQGEGCNASQAATRCHLESMRTGLKDMPGHMSACACEIIETILAVAKFDSTSLRAIASQDGGALRKLAGKIDEFGAKVNNTVGLLAVGSTLFLRFSSSMRHYIDLPVADFRRRELTLQESTGLLGTIEQRFRALPSASAPEVLLACFLLRHLKVHLEAVMLYQIRRARVLVETRNIKDFYAEFIGSKDTAPAVGPLEDIARVEYERFWVRWAAANLRLDVLKTNLRARWSRPFALAYRCATNVWAVFAVVAAPFLILAAIDLFPDGHPIRAYAGIGFLAYGVLLVGGSLALLGLAAWHNSTSRGEKSGEAVPRCGFEYECCLPRLTRLIVAPLALLVDFDHSYHFPINASDWVVVLLVLLAALATLFYIGRELSPEIEGSDANRRQLIRSIMGLALFQSFALAFLLSTLFGSNYFVHNAEFAEHSMPLLGVIPKVLEIHVGDMIPEARFSLTVYPTIILVWTALGLFTGIFLEGFLRGERIGGREED